MVGAGIYALVGAVAGAADTLAPLAFLLAAILAATTAATFAELSGRLPSAAGAAAYVQHAFGSPRLGRLVGLLMLGSAVVSAGVMFGAFSGYAGEFLDLPGWCGALLLAALVGGLAAWGIAQSVAVVAAVTVLEVGALLVVVVGGLLHETSAPVGRPVSTAGLGGVLSGAVLAFYAFVGFEDVVTTAEETRNPRRTVPLAIGLAMIVTAALYGAIALVAVRAADPSQLAASPAPMALLFETVTPWPGDVLSGVAMLAISNGALVQVIMATRVLYGLAELGTLPRRLASVHPRTQTPLTLTAAVVAAVLLASLSLPLEALARITTCLLLGVFTLVNAALLRLRQDPGTPRAPFRIPSAVPWLGAASSAALALVGLHDLWTG
jgi:amino acid transporter